MKSSAVSLMARLHCRHSTRPTAECVRYYIISPYNKHPLSKGESTQISFLPSIFFSQESIALFLFIYFHVNVDQDSHRRSTSTLIRIEFQLLRRLRSTLYFVNQLHVSCDSFTPREWTRGKKKQKKTKWHGNKKSSVGFDNRPTTANCHRIPLANTQLFRQILGKIKVSENATNLSLCFPSLKRNTTAGWLDNNPICMLFDLNLMNFKYWLCSSIDLFVVGWKGTITRPIFLSFFFICLDINESLCVTDARQKGRALISSI